MREVHILGIKVHDVTYPEALAAIEGFIASGRPHQVVTPNAEITTAAQKDAEFRQILNSAALAIPDGFGLVLASRLLCRVPLREQVTGTDLTEALIARAAVKGYGVFLLGAAEGVAELAARRWKARYPGLRIAGTFSGSPRPEHDEAQIELIRGAGRVDLLLVAYGAPAQEKWIHRNLPRLGVPVAMGIGGVLDFASGRVSRAPRWMRRAKLEWLYRLLRQPWRWRRQLALPRFALAVLKVRLLGG